MPVPSPSEPTPERSAPAVSMESVQVAFSSGQTYREIAQESGLPMSELYNRGFIQIDKEDYHQWRDMGKSKTAYCKKVGLSEILFRRILKEQNMDYPLGLSSSDQLPSPLQSTDPEDSDPNIAQTLEDNLLHTPRDSKSRCRSPSHSENTNPSDTSDALLQSLIPIPLFQLDPSLPKRSLKTLWTTWAQNGLSIFAGFKNFSG